MLGDFLLAKNIEQRIYIKFCFKNEITCSTTLEMLNFAFGECSMNETSLYKWYKRLEGDREHLEDDAPAL